MSTPVPHKITVPIQINTYLDWITHKDVYHHGKTNKLLVPGAEQALINLNMKLHKNSA